MGSSFPDLAGARSTDGYRADEQRLFADYLPGLEGLRVMKTDMWDEAKNTRILKWASEQGADCFGSRYLAADRDAGEIRVWRSTAWVCPRGDVRWLPFPRPVLRRDLLDGHGRALRRDSTGDRRDLSGFSSRAARAIVGVPNRWDPFLRPHGRGSCTASVSMGMVSRSATHEKR